MSSPLLSHIFRKRSAARVEEAAKTGPGRERQFFRFGCGHEPGTNTGGGGGGPQETHLTEAEKDTFWTEGGIN